MGGEGGPGSSSHENKTGQNETNKVKTLLRKQKLESLFQLKKR